MIALAFPLISFWIWKTMRADYGEEDILTLSLILGGAAWAASLGWKWWGLVGVLVGVILALVAWCRWKKWNVWEWIDTIARASLVMGAAAAAGRGWWLVMGILIAGAAALWGLAKIYRKIRWYLSGKPGLVGLVGGIWWMGAWMGLAPWQMYKVYLAGWVLVGLVVIIYLRSGHKFAELWPKKR